MKAPRVIQHRPRRGGPAYWYVAYYLPGVKHAIKAPVGELADLPSGKGEYWRPNKRLGQKGSVHHKKIEETIEQCVAARRAFIEGRPHQKPRARQIFTQDLLKLLDEFNTDEERILIHGRPSKSQLEKRNSAIKSILKFDPRATSQTLSDLGWCVRYKEWGEREYEGEAFRTYVNVLKTIVDWAVQKKYINVDHLVKLRIAVEKKRVVHSKTDNEQKLFSYLAETDRELFYQALFERLTGYRSADIVLMMPEDIDWQECRVLGRNSKMKRSQDDFPISHAMALLLRMVPTREPEEPLFHYRTTDNVTNRLQAACRAAGVPEIGVHQLKRDYSKEIQPATRHDRSLYNLLMHHIPKGMDAIGRTHYSGDDLEQMKMVLDSVQGHWMRMLHGFRP